MYAARTINTSCLKVNLFLKMQGADPLVYDSV